MYILENHGAVYDWNEIDLTFLSGVKIVKKRKRDGKEGRQYVNVIATFDIETTDSPETESAFMYHWQFSFLPAPGSEEISRGRGKKKERFTEPKVIFGRTWKEFTSLLSRIRDTLPSETFLAIYVQNLSYEYHFSQRFLTISNGFLAGNRIANFYSELYQCEFRCSLLLTNKSLELLTVGRVKHEKTKGDLDYRVYREPTTPLQNMEKGYCYNDVAGLSEALYLELSTWKENIATIPLTSTGHVRKDIMRAMDGYMYRIITACVMPFDLAFKMHKGFRGGDTHGNRDAIGLIWHDVAQFDRKSSYPAVLIVHKFPVSGFLKLKPEKWEKAAKSDKYSCFGKIRYTNLRIKRESPDPYIPSAKCEILKKPFMDNGRVLFADSADMYITDIDYEIISECYDYDTVEVLEAWAALAGYLPKAFTSLIIKYFGDKERLSKQIKEERKKNGKSEKWKLLQEEYGKTKNLINSLYGCLAEWIHPEDWQYSTESGDFADAVNWDTLTPDERKARMMEAWDKRNRTRLPYQWGVWCTAWARWEYFQGVKCCKVDGFSLTSAFIYGDTDSNKFVDRPEIRENYKKLNDRIKKQCEDQPYTKGYIDLDGRRIYLGVWEEEPKAALFRTWGAKKYAERFYDGTIEITVAGLSKQGGSEYLRMLGGIHAFDPGEKGLLFPEHYAGRLTAKYSEPIEPYKMTLRSGDTIETAGFVRLLPTTYKLNIGGDLSDLIQLVQYTDGNLTQETIEQWLIEEKEIKK